MNDHDLIIGIDFGTTNSKIAYIKNDRAEVIPNHENDFVTPSIVHMKEDFLNTNDIKAFYSRFIVGQQARGYLITEPERTFYSIKRNLGQNLTINIDQQAYKPEFIAAIIFKQLMLDAEQFFNQEVNQAIVSVPANYSDSQRQAIKDAAEIAGFNVLRLINEPTAAALAYGLTLNTDQKLLIYDFGGGTFDVTVVSVSNGFFDIDASTGINKCGGDDIDELLIKHVLDYIKKTSNSDVSHNLNIYRTLRDACEQAKISLSTKDSTTIQLPFISDTKGAQINVNYSISRTTFESLITPIVAQTKQPIIDALSAAGLKPENIDQILLVGGTSKIPLVRSFLGEIFPPEKIKFSIDPFHAVALGAAVCSLSTNTPIGERSRLDISDICSHSYGIQVLDYDDMGLQVSHIVKKNDKLPVKRTGGPFVNAFPYTQKLSFDVFQGESTDPSDNILLGNMLVTVPPKALGGNRFEVTLSVGEQFGILETSAHDLDSHQVFETKFSIQGILTSAEKAVYAETLGIKYLNISVYRKDRQTKHIFTMMSTETIKTLITKLLELKIFSDLTPEAKPSLYLKNKRVRMNAKFAELVSKDVETHSSGLNNEVSSEKGITKISSGEDNIATDQSDGEEDSQSDLSLELRLATT